VHRIIAKTVCSSVVFVVHVLFYFTVANEQMVSDIVSMGFDRESVVAALELCMNNPESAIDYLMTGVPPGLISEMEDFLIANPESQCIFLFLYIFVQTGTAVCW